MLRKAHSLRFRHASILIFVFAGVAASCAQWIPLAAKTTESREVIKSDGSSSHETVEGILYRASNGTQLERTKLFHEGKLVEDTAGLIDNVRLRAYKIDFANRTVQEIKKFDSPRTPGSLSAQGDKPLPEEIVNGLRCAVFPVVLSDQTVGKMWISKDLDIPIKSDYTISAQGYKTHIQSQTHDIQANHEPDKSVFVVDSSFQVLPSLAH